MLWPELCRTMILNDLKPCQGYQGFDIFSRGRIHVWSFGFPVWLRKGNLEAAVLPRDVSATCHLKLQNPHFHWDLHPLNPILPIATLKFLYILGCYFLRLEVIEGRIPSPINTTRLKTIHAQKEKLHAPPKGKVGKLGLAGCLPITPLFFCWISQFPATFVGYIGMIQDYCLP